MSVNGSGSGPRRSCRCGKSDRPGPPGDEAAAARAFAKSVTVAPNGGEEGANCELPTRAASANGLDGVEGVMGWNRYGGAPPVFGRWLSLNSPPAAVVPPQS